MEWVVGMQVVAPRAEPLPPREPEGWFLAYTNERSEQRAADALRQRGIPTLVFHERVERKVRGRVVACDLALFPRYVFMELTKRDFVQLRGTPGLERLVRTADGLPARMPEDVVKALAARAHRGDFDHTSRAAGRRSIPARGHREGDRVEIVSGPYRQFVGTVDRLLPKARVEMLLTLFGRTTRVEMPVKDLATP